MARWLLGALGALMFCTPALGDQASAIQALKAQPRVVDARADKSGNMYVLVKAENVSWSHFASAVCAFVRPHQGRIFRVRVVELTQADYGKSPASWPRLAEASCAK